MRRNTVNVFRLLVVSLATASLSCSGGQSEPQMPAAPDPDTRATLAGPLCSTSRCECSEDPAKIGAAEEGLKRFRVKLGPSQSQLWATIGKNVFHKSIERATSCFYVDLPAGQQAIALRAKGKGGFGAGMEIREVGGEGPWLYPTFNFNCGAPGLCDMQGLSNWKRSLKAVSAGKHAPCGSVRILGVDWATGRMPDNLHPEDFHLTAQMKIYKFQPKHPPGTQTCSKE